MWITIVRHTVDEISGLTTFDLSLAKELSKSHRVKYLYTAGDPEPLEEMRKYAFVEQEAGKPHDTDVCIYSSLTHGMHEPFIRAKKYIQMVHADPKVIPGWKPNLTQKTQWVCVGYDVQKILKEVYGVDAAVIENIVSPFTEEKVLRLITVSRIAEFKGFDRIPKLARRMKAEGRRFIWEIHGEGSYNVVNQLKYDLSGIPEVCIVGHHSGIQNYIKGHDYLVQLSDHEGFCYSVHEALQVGVPCLVTDWPNNVIQDGINGYVLPMDLEGVNLDRVFDEIPVGAKPAEYKTIEKWVNILESN